MAFMLMMAPVRVGSLMLTAVGRARDVLRPFALATVINLTASVLLVIVMGVAGTFIGTLIGTAVLVVPLARMASREVGSTYRDLIRTSILPAVLPAALLAAVLLLLPVLGLEGRALLVTGAVGGGALYCATAVLVSLSPAERRDLWSMVRRLPAPAASGG
jgi:O-antigen/teichoic acid export membrane protein